MRAIRRRGRGVARTLHDVFDHRGPGAGPRLSLGPHRPERADDGQKREPVEQERERDPISGDEQAGHGGAHHAGTVEHRRVEGDSARQVVPADQVGHERLAGGHVQRRDQAVERGEHRHMPVLHVPRPRQRGEGEGLQHQRGLGGQDEPPLAHPIGDGAGQEREEQHRAELKRAEQPELERRIGQLEHEPRLADALHPGPDERHDLAGKEQAVVPVTERPHSGPWHGSRDLRA